MLLDEVLQSVHGTVSTLLREHFCCFDWVQQELASTLTCNSSNIYYQSKLLQIDVTDSCIRRGSGRLSSDAHLLLRRRLTLPTPEV